MIPGSSKQIAFFYFLFLLTFPSVVLAQIQGSVRDTTDLPIGYANVLLLNQADSTVATGVMATDEGTYSITNFKPGKYIIGASLIGYQPAYSKPFTILLRPGGKCRTT